MYIHKSMFILDQVQEPAEGKAVEKIITQLQDEFDRALSMKDVKSSFSQGTRPRMAKFLDSHTRQHRYFLCIKKCGEESCLHCSKPRLSQKMHFLPVPVLDGEHYKPFQVSMITIN